MNEILDSAASIFFDSSFFSPASTNFDVDLWFDLWFDVLLTRVLVLDETLVFEFAFEFAFEFKILLLLFGSLVWLARLELLRLCMISNIRAILNARRLYLIYTRISFSFMYLSSSLANRLFRIELVLVRFNDQVHNARFHILQTCVCFCMRGLKTRIQLCSHTLCLCVSGITVKCSFVILESVVFLARLLQGTIL